MYVCRVRCDFQALEKRVLLVQYTDWVHACSLVMRYTKDQFSSEHALTIGAAFVSKDLTVTVGGAGRRPKDTTIRLHIWDTAGEEAYRSMTRFFYRDAACGGWLC